MRMQNLNGDSIARFEISCRKDRPDGSNAHRLRAAGQPIPVTQAKIADPVSGDEMPLGEVGEIYERVGSADFRPKRSVSTF